MSRNFCQACSFARFGVKTRIAIPHTCGGNPVFPKVKHQYIPTREELDKYLKRLEELMREDEKT
jgi:hypothetical protein